MGQTRKRACRWVSRCPEAAWLTLLRQVGLGYLVRQNVGDENERPEGRNRIEEEKGVQGV